MSGTEEAAVAATANIIAVAGGQQDRCHRRPRRFLSETEKRTILKNL